MDQLDILAIFAHPDDVELTVGGTLLRMKHLGYKTGALDVTRGEMGTRGTVEGREEEARNATKILKLDVRENLGLRDGHVFCDDESRTKLVRVFASETKGNLSIRSTSRIGSLSHCPLVRESHGFRAEPVHEETGGEQIRFQRCSQYFSRLLRPRSL